MFTSRQEAGIKLSSKLSKYKGWREGLILAIPRGGVMVAAAVARRLKLPLDVVITRKICAPFQSELALGAIDEDGEIVWEEEILKEVGLDKNDLSSQISQELGEIERRISLYRHGKRLTLRNRNVLLIDDGIATGATVISAIRFIYRHGCKELVLAIPVVAKEVYEKLIPQLDQLESLEAPPNLESVGNFYHDFRSVSDVEVIAILKGYSKL